MNVSAGVAAPDAARSVNFPKIAVQGPADVDKLMANRPKRGSPYLFSKDTQAIFFNAKPLPVQRMLDFDYLCKRELPSVAALVSPGASGGFHKFFLGAKEVAIPLYGSTEEACARHPNADVFINFASFRSAYPSTKVALEQDQIRTAVIIAEGVPENDIRRLMVQAKKNQQTIIGPATVGGIMAGGFKIGDTAGTTENIIECKLYRPGSVGFVSKSGGMSNEMYNVLSRHTDGLYEGIAIGGDVYPGSTLLDHVLRFEQIPEIKMIVVLGEIGGTIEHEIADALKEKKITKPLVAWVSGTIAKTFPTEVQFGHAGAKSGGEMESAQAKIEALKAAGAVVPTSFDGFQDAVAATYKKLVQSGAHKPREEEVEAPSVPMDLSTAVKQNKVRLSTGIVSSICDDRGGEPSYNGVPMSTIIEKNYGVGDVISLLWFKRELPRWATKFIEMCVVIVADHGPCVSGAHNTIVAARAGKDVVSSLVSGLLTIGPRFGGAIDDAARYFKEACDKEQDPVDMVEGLKKAGKRVAGIGHRIKSASNRDKRVELLTEYARKNFPSTRYLDYAYTVEEYTLTKANNLVLNVDGCIGTCFLDLLESANCFTQEEVKDIINIGYLNGLFVLGRSIGLIGHTFDQKRLKQPLYRHAWADVLYL